jgi:hypothetical protein
MERGQPDEGFVRALIAIAAFLLTWVADAQTNDDSGCFVRLIRAKSDSAYAKLLDKHRCIKAYLNSPLRGDPKIEQLLLFLLRNGYSIESLDKAFRALRVPIGVTDMSPELEAPLVERGVPAEDIEETAAAVRQRAQTMRLRVLKFLTGVDNQELLNELVKFAPRESSPVELGALRLADPVEGEKLLTDADWMREEHRRAAASYLGEPRTMFPNAALIRGERPVIVPRPGLPLRDAPPEK